MSKLRITYYAEGHRNGCVVTLHDVCGLVHDDFIIDANRWYSCRYDLIFYPFAYQE